MEKGRVISEEERRTIDHNGGGEEKVTAHLESSCFPVPDGGEPIPSDV